MVYAAVGGAVRRDCRRPAIDSFVLPRLLVPTYEEIGQLGVERNALQAGIEQLEKRGARIKMATCGNGCALRPARTKAQEIKTGLARGTPIAGCRL